MARDKARKTFAMTARASAEVWELLGQVARRHSARRRDVIAACVAQALPLLAAAGDEEAEVRAPDPELLRPDDAMTGNLADDGCLVAFRAHAGGVVVVYPQPGETATGYVVRHIPDAGSDSSPIEIVLPTLAEAEEAAWRTAAWPAGVVEPVYRMLG